MSPSPSPSHAAYAGTAIPPDWSGFIPDLIVALVTGAAVGLFVILAERWISARTRKREMIRRQNVAVQASERWMVQDLRYLTLSVLPAASNIRRVRAQVRGVGADPDDLVVQAFTYLVGFLDAWEGLKSVAEDLEQHIKIATITAGFGNPDMGILSIRHFIVINAYQDGERWENIATYTGAPSLATDAKLRQGAEEYIHVRAVMEGWREAYLRIRRELRKSLDNLAKEAMDMTEPGDRNNRRVRRMLRKRREDARVAADLAGHRYARTILAKASHKTEAVFGWQYTDGQT